MTEDERRRSREGDKKGERVLDTECSAICCSGFGCGPFIMKWNFLTIYIGYVLSFA